VDHSDNTTLSAKCKVRISQVTGGAPNDSSHAYFEIVSGATPTVTLTFPNDKMTWFTGTPMQVTWTSTGTFDSVKVEYTTNAVAWRSIGAVLNGAGKYIWNIPDTVTPSIHCSVRITGVVTGQPTDVSAFRIHAYRANDQDRGAQWRGKHGIPAQPTT